MTGNHDTRPVPHADEKTREAVVMKDSSTRLHNSGAGLLVIDGAGHLLGGGETTDVVIDTVTQKLIDGGKLIVVDKPVAEKAPKRAPRQHDADNDKEGE